MLALGDYGSGSDDDDASDDEPPPKPSVLLPPLAAQVVSSDDDEDEDIVPQSGRGEVDQGSSAVVQEEGGAEEGLPSIEDVLANTSASEFLTAPKEEFEHQSFDRKAPDTTSPTVPSQSAESSGYGMGMGKKTQTAEQMAHAARLAKQQASGKGKPAGKGAEKKGESIKDRTKNKRKLDQSASFLGGRWKTEEEMHLRDHFDS
ncbi:hypothetical protein AB1Y20_006842 [Prymnesium parvum]|uniref:Uncharacterized protein n=1 Tax=Prymnesium parvum TaxID=97485 RepID=A0AB34J1I9_PRYPA